MKKTLIVYSNPWSFSLAAEREIARRGAREGRVDVVDLYRLATRKSPLGRWVDHAAETLNRKFERFLLPVINGRNITREIETGRLKVPPIPQDLQSLRSYRVGSARVGLAVLSTVTSITTVQRPTSMEEYGPSLEAAWKSAHIAVEVGLAIRERGYDEVYVFNGRHCHTRPICDLAEETATVFRYEQGGTGTRFVKSPVSIHQPEEIARLICEHDGDPEVGRRFFEERLRKVPGNPVAFFTSGQQAGHLPPELQGKDIVSLFTSSSDEMFAVSDTVSYGEFPDQYSLALALARACRTRGAQLVVRLHPHLLYKHESWKREWDLEALRREGIIILDPADKTDTYALAAVSSCVITCGSTVGLECAYLGKPCAEVGPRVAGLIGATASIVSEADVQRFIANPHMPDGARDRALQYGSYAREGGEPLPELDPGTHPDYSRIDGRVVDPVRFMARRVRSRFGREPYIPLPPGGKIVLDPTIAKAMSK